jgi:predicted choloylglycine hydrolase
MMSILKIGAKVLMFTILIVFSLVICFSIYVNETLVITEPPTEVEVIGDAEGHISKNELGIWEIYLKGSPYDRGVKYGELTSVLLRKQEDIFIDQLNQFVPNTFFQKILRVLIGFFNRNIIYHIPTEYSHEIFGVSQSFSEEYNYILPRFMRILNYHAAHDLGHALNDYSLVGCTSFGVVDTTDGRRDVLIGRNFDFYVGDEFAERKLLMFLDPSTGYSFASYSWAGFMGVASGMNEKGLSVTINSAMSTPPTSAKTPIALLAREILQYSKNIEEAIEITKKREVFVSEIIMVGSKEDGEIALIEKSPTEMGVYFMEGNRIICSNHYQSSIFSEDEMNVYNINHSESLSRYRRVEELVPASGDIDIKGIVSVLRDQHDVGGDTLGMGNPKAINQLMAHHSVVFDNQNIMMYVSTHDWQLGPYAGYDLTRVFETGKIEIADTIPPSLFLQSEGYESFMFFKKIKSRISNHLVFGTELNLDNDTIEAFITSNSESYITYEILGNYYLHDGDIESADKMFNMALSKNIPSTSIEEKLTALISSNSN